MNFSRPPFGNHFCLDFKSLVRSVLVAQKLRTGNGLSDLAAIPLSRRAQRLMHDGRTKAVRSHVKLDLLTQDTPAVTVFPGTIRGAIRV